MYFQFYKIVEQAFQSLELINAKISRCGCQFRHKY